MDETRALTSHRAVGPNRLTASGPPHAATCPSRSPAFFLDRVFIRAIAWPRAGPPVPAGPRMPFMLPSLRKAKRMCIAPQEVVEEVLGKVSALVGGYEPPR